MTSARQYRSLSEYAERLYYLSRSPEAFNNCEINEEETWKHWSLPHIGAMLFYALQLSMDPRCDAIIHEPLMRLDCIACRILAQHRVDVCLWSHETDGVQDFFKEASRFIPDFRTKIVAPRIQDWSDVADYFNFLLIMLETGRTMGFPLPNWDYVSLLEKEMKFVLAFLGDRPILLQEAMDLSKKIGVAARALGDFVHGCFLRQDQESVASSISFELPLSKKIEIAAQALRYFLRGSFLREDHQSFMSSIYFELQRMEDIKSDIRELISNTSIRHLLSTCNTYPETTFTATVESLFIVDSLISDLEDLMNLKVGDEIRMLHRLMTSSIAILREEKKLNIWAEMSEFREVAIQIKDTAYEAEYLIKSFTDYDRDAWYLIPRLHNLIQKMEFIETTLQQMNINDNISGALEFRLRVDPTENKSPQTPQSSTLDDDIEVGLDEKSVELLDQLVGQQQQLQIISICGMPGLGKTTTAKKLYNHPSVRVHFDKHSWCVVSQTYQRKQLLASILTHLDNSFCENTILGMEEKFITEKIYKTLKGRRYLVVMDDIWNVDLWDEIKRYFPNDGNGSRIMFTSRITNAVPEDSIINTPSFLSEDQCWELLEKKVFRKESNCPPDLEEIGRQIAGKCGGLPLAVVVVAGILATMDKDEYVWEKMKRSLDSCLIASSEHCKEILELSYRHLPDYLKPCFLYFGAYREDENILVSDLLRLWNGEGFIIPNRTLEDKNPENIARDYLMELVDRSLVMVVERSSTGGVKRCGVHDLLHELCVGIAVEENFMRFITSEGSMSHNQRVRVGSPLWFPFGLHVRSFTGMLQLHSLFWRNMKLLRLLNSSGPLYLNVNEHASSLVHVRYLNSVENFSTSIANLVKLEYLVLHQVPTPFPSFLLRLPKLRYLSVPVIKLDQDLDISTSSTIKLEDLSTVAIRTLKDKEILKSCIHLTKLKCYIRSSGSQDLRSLTQLKSLGAYGNWDGPMSSQIGEVIYFPSSIKKLTLRSTKLPLEDMSRIGKLPKLEVLKISLDAFVGETWETKDDGFQELRFLKLESIDIEKWEVASSEHFPRLRRLVLNRCYKLQEIPSEIGDIPTLEQIEVQYCSESAAESASQILEEQQEMGNEDLKIFTTRSGGVWYKTDSSELELEESDDEVDGD